MACLRGSGSFVKACAGRGLRQPSGRKTIGVTSTMTALAYYCKKLNKPTSDPGVNSSLPRKKMVSSDPHRLWAKMGGYFRVVLGRWCRGSPTQTLMVWANMPSIFWWPRILWVSMMDSKAGQSVSGQGFSYAAGSCCPASSRGGSRAVGLHCLSGVCRAAGLWTSSAPGSTHWPLTWEHPLWPRLPPNSLALVKQLHSEAGSWVGKAAERVSNPDKIWREGLEFQSWNLPVSLSCTCI